MVDANLNVKINAQENVSQAFKDIENNLKKLKDASTLVGGAMVAMGVAIVGSATLSIKKYAEMGSAVHDLALKTGFSTEAISEWSYALEQSGSDASALQIAMRTLSNAIVGATEGSESQRKAFERINVDYKALRALKPEQQFETIAYAVGGLKDQTLKAAVAQDLFGRSGMNLLPLLAEGKDGIAKLRKEANDLGIVFDQVSADSADRLGDSLDTLGKSFDGLKIAIAQNLLPTLQPLIDNVTKIIADFRKWADANPELAKTLTRLTVESGLVLGTFGTLVLVIPRITTAVRTLTTANIALSASFVLPVAAIASVIAIYAKLKSQWSPEALSPTAYAWAKIDTEIKNTDGSIRKVYEDFKVYSQAEADRLEKLGYTISYVRTQAQTLAEQLAEALVKQQQELKDSAAAIRSTYDLFKTASEQYKHNLDDELQKARTVTDEKISLLRKEYDEKIHTLNAEADAATKAIQDQIDALDKQTANEDDALREQECQRRQAELEKAVHDAETYDEHRRAEQELKDYLVQITRDRLLEQRTAEKDALREKIDDIRSAAKDEQTRLEQELVTKQEHENALLKQTEDRITQQSKKLDAALNQELARVSTELFAVEQAEKDKLKSALERIDEVIKALNTIPPEINVDVNIHEHHSSDNLGSGLPPTGTLPPVTGMARGGVINEPTLLFGLASRRPYAIAGESGREYVSPGEGNTFNINIELDGRIVSKVVAQQLGKELRLQGVY